MFLYKTRPHPLGGVAALSTEHNHWGIIFENNKGINLFISSSKADKNLYKKNNYLCYAVAFISKAMTIWKATRACKDCVDTVLVHFVLQKVAEETF